MNEIRDEWEGAQPELHIHSTVNEAAADYVILPPPPAHSIPLEYVHAPRGRQVTVAAFAAGSRTPTHHRGFRAWSEPYRAAVNTDTADPFLWRIDVCTEEDWWRNRFTGARPSWVESFPVVLVWIDEEAATKHVAPWPPRT